MTFLLWNTKNVFEEISNRKFEGLEKSLLWGKIKLQKINIKFTVSENVFLIRSQWNFDRQKHLPFSQRFPSNPGGQLHWIVAILSMHVPPFMHGTFTLLDSGRRSEIHNMANYLVLHFRFAFILYDWKNKVLLNAYHDWVLYCYSYRRCIHQCPSHTILPRILKNKKTLVAKILQS